MFVLVVLLFVVCCLGYWVLCIADFGLGFSLRVMVYMVLFIGVVSSLAVRLRLCSCEGCGVAFCC